MISPPLTVGMHVILERAHFQSLLDALLSRNYHVVGPTLRDQAIVYDTLTSVSDLPAGYTDVQDGGSYQLKKRSDNALFGYNVGPQSWKRFLHEPVLRLWQGKRDEKGFHIVPETYAGSKFAFIGVRSCELHAIAIQDTVFIQGPYPDMHYQQRRQDLCIIAVNCGQAGNTCFCSSMQTGPQATADFDLALTEIIRENEHHFIIEIGTTLGLELVQALPYRSATDDTIQQVEQIMQNTTQQMGRKLDLTNIKDLLYQNMEHPRWKDVASRCLSCGNCTMVCPTCFCTSVEDVTDLTGKQAERWRKWDSCFTTDFSYISGGSIRSSVKSRYRQWMTHKLASWIDQFGTSGCVGCGRCITWCPVGIDITEEVRAIRDSLPGREADREAKE